MFLIFEDVGPSEKLSGLCLFSLRKRSERGKEEDEREGGRGMRKKSGREGERENRRIDLKSSM